jgi:hypothetical protein
MPTIALAFLCIDLYRLFEKIARLLMWCLVATSDIQKRPTAHRQVDGVRVSRANTLARFSPYQFVAERIG